MLDDTAASADWDNGCPCKPQFNLYPITLLSLRGDHIIDSSFCDGIHSPLIPWGATCGRPIITNTSKETCILPKTTH